jgi:histidinol-phosphate aminotransferase
VPYDPKNLPAKVLLSANESPYGLADETQARFLEALATTELNRYPDPLARDLRTKIADFCAVPEQYVLIGNGGDELIFNLLLAWGGPGRRLLITPPSFGSYELFSQLTGTDLLTLARTKDMRIDEAALLERLGRGDVDLVMFASPNNPTGDCLHPAFIERVLAATDALVLLDQAYIEFADAAYDATHLLDRFENLAILRTFSKAFGLAGVRLGYLLASPLVTETLCKVRQPYSVDAVSALAGIAALDTAEIMQKRAAITVAQRTRVAAALAALPGVHVFDSEANFLLVRIEGAAGLWQRLLDEHGVLVRDFSRALGLADCLRVSIGTPAENDAMLEAIRCVRR